jgi:hypothetical protein
MDKNLFSVVALCSLTEVYSRFRDVCWLHRQGDRPDAWGNNPEDDIGAAVRT